MVTVLKPRDFVITLKKETFLNVGTLSKVHSMPVDLSRQIFNENGLEKLTQNVFNHLTYYLVSIVDRAASSRLPWPLYDSETERTYRNELSNIITDYSNKGLLSPVMSSYLVNPGSPKVTFLIFQLSQLAVQRTLLSKIDKDREKVYSEFTQMYKSAQDNDFIEAIEEKTTIISSKLGNYLCKKDMLVKMAETMKNRITHMEKTYFALNTETFLDNLVDNYVKEHNLDCETKKEILMLKNVKKESKFFDTWLDYLDIETEKLELNWDGKMTPMLEASKRCEENTKELIARHTGEVERKTFTVEYNPRTDQICTDTLEDQVNSEQKYILKNIVKKNKLNFPYLIRGCMISMFYVLKNIEIGDEIYRFNEYLEDSRKNYTEIISTMKILLERIMKAENKLEIKPPILSQNLHSKLPPRPDLSGLKMNTFQHGQVLFDAVTPWKKNKLQFNLQRKCTTANNSFLKPAPRSLVITNFHKQQRDEFKQSNISCQIRAYDCQNTVQLPNIQNLSINPQINYKGNETIAECSTAFTFSKIFTKQQIDRLLSTKKCSSTKKHKIKTDRPLMNIKKRGLFNESMSSNESIVLTRSQSSPNLFDNRDERSQLKKHEIKTDRPLMNIKKRGLFNESMYSNESIVLTRSQSSPNLFDNRDKRSQLMVRGRKLSIVEEDIPSILKVSGIAALDKDSHSTPQGGTGLETSRKLLDSPHFVSTSDTNEKFNIVLNEEIKDKSIEMQQQPTQQRVSWKQTEELRKSTEFTEQKTETPKRNTKPIDKTNSLEKLINRFKQIRSRNLPTDSKQDYTSEIRPILEEKEKILEEKEKILEEKEKILEEREKILEEKENLNTVNVDVFTANRILLPDLLSPSCSFISQKSNDLIEQWCFEDNDKLTRQRESLGTALGVDHTFLDQFDLTDSE